MSCVRKEAGKGGTPAATGKLRASANTVPINERNMAILLGGRGRRERSESVERGVALSIQELRNNHQGLEPCVSSNAVVPVFDVRFSLRRYRKRLRVTALKRLRRRRS
jgi:hypothetical protein